MDGNAEPLQPQPTDDAATTDGLDRRAILLAGGAALAGAAAAALAGAERADAGHNTDIAYDTQTVMHVDVTNTTAGSTRVSTNISGTAAFVGLNNYPVGISRPDGILGRTAYTTSNAAGVAGTNESAVGGIGVMGAAKATDGTGVFGVAGTVVPSEDPPAGTGVFGRGPTNGIVGLSSDGVGVAGTSANAAGVKGQSTSANGVHGASASGTGVRGETTTGGVGVLGVAGSGGVAGRFVGPAVVEGSLAANAVDVGGAAKVGSTLDVGGAAKVGSTLEVAGQATLGALTARGNVEAAGAVHLASTLDVTGRATVAALQVAGAAHFAGPVTLGQEQEIGKLRLPKTSGVVTLKRAAASVSVPNVELAAGTLVLATIQTLRKGLVVAAAVPSPKGKKITIHFNKRAPKGTKVAWMLVN
jgi:hypothetical protein